MAPKTAAALSLGSTRPAGGLKGAGATRGYISCRHVRANIGRTWNFGYILRDSSGESRNVPRSNFDLYDAYSRASCTNARKTRQKTRVQSSASSPSSSSPSPSSSSSSSFFPSFSLRISFSYFFEKVASNTEQQSTFFFKVWKSMYHRRHLFPSLSLSSKVSSSRFFPSSFPPLLRRRRHPPFFAVLPPIFFFLTATLGPGGCTFECQWRPAIAVRVYPSGCVWAALVGAKILTFGLVEVGRPARPRKPSRNSER